MGNRIPFLLCKGEPPKNDNKKVTLGLARPKPSLTKPPFPSFRYFFLVLFVLFFLFIFPLIVRIFRICLFFGFILASFPLSCTMSGLIRTLRIFQGLSMRKTGMTGFVRDGSGRNPHNWQRGSTGVEREFSRATEHFGTHPFQSPSLSGIRLYFVRPHFPSPNTNKIFTGLHRDFRGDFVHVFLLAAQCEIPPHIARYPFEIVSQRGVSHLFALFS